LSFQEWSAVAFAPTRRWREGTEPLSDQARVDVVIPPDGNCHFRDFVEYRTPCGRYRSAEDGFLAQVGEASRGLKGTRSTQRYLAEREAGRGLPPQRTLDASPARLISQQPPSSREFGRFIPIYLWMVVAGLIQIEERFELFELL
jgi:hypothetical protein